ncbi:MAG TPA: hypothetical protein VI485_17810 [Vicinamibacterales bacterium]|nr:hypothetical protein [Vicinamibacterales bacterium]
MSYFVRIVFSTPPTQTAGQADGGAFEHTVTDAQQRSSLLRPIVSGDDNLLSGRDRPTSGGPGGHGRLGLLGSSRSGDTEEHEHRRGHAHSHLHDSMVAARVVGSLDWIPEKF